MNKNSKFGFTLAEILIAMGIAGAIAALTIPQLVVSTQSNKFATALGRSVETIETGCQALIQDAGEYSSDGEIFGHALIEVGYDTRGTAPPLIIADSKLFENAGAFFDATPLSDSQQSSYTGSVKSYTGGAPSPRVSSIAGKFAVNTKLGAYYGVLKRTDEANADDPLVELIYIDVNGANPPNRYGRDVFLFGLTDACHMIPAGTNRMNSWYSGVALATSACDGGNVTNGLSCTERVVREGFKNNYSR